MPFVLAAEGLAVGERDCERSQYELQHFGLKPGPWICKLLFLLAPFVIGLSGVAIGLFIASSRHFEIMLSALPNSAWAMQKNIVGTTSLASRCYLVSTLSGALLFSEFNVRKGVLDPNDVSNFPSSLRRLMTLSNTLAFVGMAWLCLAVGLIKLTGS